MEALSTQWERHGANILLAFKLGCISLAWLCLLFSMSYINMWSLGVPIKEVEDACKFWGNPTGIATLQQCELLSRNRTVAMTLSISAIGSMVMLIVIAGYDILFYSLDSDEDT